MPLVTAPELIKEYYTAIVDKDVKYKDRFITAVKTTGIYCYATCYARKPKMENVEFYDTKNEAVATGYRACKLCKP